MYNKNEIQIITDAYTIYVTYLFIIYTKNICNFDLTYDILLYKQNFHIN